MLAREIPLKPAMNKDYRALATFPTNYVPRDEEGKQIKARVAQLEIELKDLRGQIEKRMVDDSVYKETKSKVDADKQEWLDIEKRKGELMKERTEVAGKYWKLQQMMKAAENASKAKAQETGTGTPAP